MKNNILLEIVDCNEILEAKGSKTHPCHKIVTYQEKEFQQPEPWNGNIETADILFVSSNPSYDEQENYPNQTWSAEEVISFFENRFTNTSEKDYSVYWKSVKKWAGWVIPNIEWDKIALTEIVHCKSQKEYGVTECQNHCAEKWLEKVLSLFHGKYIVLVGKVAQQHYEKIKTLVNDKTIIQTPHVGRPVKGLTDEVRKQSFYDQIHNA